MKQAARKDFVEAFARGLEVIKAFDELHPVLGISEVAERANLARPTAHRFLLTLEELGYVISTPVGYMLTPKIVDLGMAYISSRGIFNLAQTHMEQLVYELDQSCSLTQLDGSDVVYVARVTVPKIIHLAVTVGARLPAVGTAMGHVLLAELDDEKLDEVIQTPTLSVWSIVAHRFAWARYVYHRSNLRFSRDARRFFQKWCPSTRLGFAYGGVARGWLRPRKSWS